MTAILIDESGDHAVVGVDSFEDVWVGASQLTSLIPAFLSVKWAVMLVPATQVSKDSSRHTM